MNMEEEIYWILDADMPGLAIEPPAYLAVEELARLADMRFPKRRTEWLHGRRTAKKLLQRCHPVCSSLPLSEIIIKNELTGMPYPCQKNGGQMTGCLSISHRDRIAVSALTLVPSLRVGVDLEKVEPRQANFVADFFTPMEFERVYILPPDDRPEMITLIWSAKEAALKALGQGLRLDTRTVEISIPDQDEYCIGTQGWSRFEVTTRLTPGKVWHGWWRDYKNYVLTVAALCYNDSEKNSSPGVKCLAESN
jgi:4'-phosphopantetheinyl transferase